MMITARFTEEEAAYITELVESDAERGSVYHFHDDASAATILTKLDNDGVYSTDDGTELLSALRTAAKALDGAYNNRQTQALTDALVLATRLLVGTGFDTVLAAIECRGDYPDDCPPQGIERPGAPCRDFPVPHAALTANGDGSYSCSTCEVWNGQ